MVRISIKNRLSLTILSVLITLYSQAGTFTQWVNPFIGTGAVKNSLSGNTYPGATLPFGMVQLSPDTQESRDWANASGYDYNDNTIYGFSHTRLSGTGASDLIDILLMPTTSSDNAKPKSSFSHKNEIAHPGYYKVKLDDYNITAELSATTRTGIHQYTYPPDGMQRLFLDVNHSANKGSWNRIIIQSQIKIIDSTTIEGFRVITGWAKLRKIYFLMKLSKPIISHMLIDGNRKEYNATVINGTELYAYLDFDKAEGNTLMCKVALSSVSTDNARMNMDKEAKGWNFDEYVKAADNIWDRELSKVEVEGSDANRQIFYTALYHTLIQPNTMSDVNGEYTSTDYSTKKMQHDETYYSTLSLWDTFRAAHPLYSLIEQKRNAEIVNSMLQHFDSYGYLPIWDLWGQDNYCMIGNHSVPVIIDAILKNTQGIDLNKAYKAVVASCTTSHPGSPFEVLEKYAYIPENILSQSVSITMEQSFDDWCVAMLAKKMNDVDTYKHFIRRSGNYKNLYNPSTSFFQAKDDKGKWIEPFDPLKYGSNGDDPYTEGNAWQYYWYVPQDINGLITITGGKKAFIKKLDTFFSLNDSSGKKNDNASGFIGQYVHGNEPSHHIAYLYDYAGLPRKTQQRVAQIMRTMYNTSSSGYAGNDDCGEMSAWYVFSAMGFYPVNPASNEYAIGTPLFDKCIIHLSNGNSFSIISKHKTPEHIFIKSIKLNGKFFNKSFIDYETMAKGGTMEF